MPKPGRRSIVVASLCGLTLALVSCAHPPGFLQSKPEAAEPVAPNDVGFDVNMVGRLIPGLTAREQVRGWFGEPDAQTQRGDGSSQWIYNKARLLEEDPERVAMEERARERRAADEARQLREESLELLESGRRAMDRFGAWLDRKIFYPPSPARQNAFRAKERSWADADARKRREAPKPDEVDRADAELLADQTEPIMKFDLAILFTRDGVVDEFQYQRTAGRDYVP